MRLKLENGFIEKAVQVLSHPNSSGCRPLDAFHVFQVT